jgi:kynureninase
MLLKIRDKLTESHNAILTIRDARKQVEGTVERTKSSPAASEISNAAKALNAKLTTIEEELYQTKNQSSQDPLNYPIRLNNKLAALGGVVASADAAPTDQSYQLYDDLTKRIDAQLQIFRQTLERDVPTFNRLVRERDIPAIIIK